jgi:dihydrofolate reductase
LLALFLENNLVDEMHIITIPMLLGDGVPIFRDVKGPLPLKLTSSQVFDTGWILHVYTPA